REGGGGSRRSLIIIILHFPAHDLGVVFACALLWTGRVRRLQDERPRYARALESAILLGAAIVDKDLCASGDRLERDKEDAVPRRCSLLVDANGQRIVVPRVARLCLATANATQERQGVAPDGIVLPKVPPHHPAGWGTKHAED